MGVEASYLDTLNPMMTNQEIVKSIKLSLPAFVSTKISPF